MARLRRTIQALLFLLFLALLWAPSTSLQARPVAQLVPRLSPLDAIAAMLAAQAFLGRYWPALLVLASAIVLGRFFCKWVCPLGTTIDVADAALSRVRAKRPSLYDGRRLKYYLLLFLVVLALFGGQVAGWFDPLSIALRTYGLVLYPYAALLVGSLLGFLSRLPLVGWAAEQAPGTWFLREHAYQGHMLLLLLLVLILAGGLAYRRYWCRNLCPLGALLALVSDWSLFKRVVDEKCVECGRCRSACGMGAIDRDGKGTRTGECTLCMTCRDVCPAGAIRFRLGQPEEQQISVDLTKRGFLTSCLSGVAALPLLKLGFRRRSAESLIRPPGAGEEAEFLTRCVSCGACMKACPTNGLHPTGLEAGLEGLWTPRLIPRVGYCEYHCTRCGQACPSGAIRELTPEQKTAVSIGKARFDRNRCIPWVGHARHQPGAEVHEDVNCGVCEEFCPIPTKAIRFSTVVIDAEQGVEIRRPYVVEDLCIGCGRCEYACPVSGRAAVQVEGQRGTVTVPESAALARFFPAVVGSWQRLVEPTTYSGNRRFYEYLDGGAEPYLTFALKHIAVAVYRRRGAKDRVKLDLWELESSDEAFGVYSKDRAGEPIDLGDEASMFGNFLWAWKDRYFLRAEPHGACTAAETAELGRAVLAGIQAPKAKRPPLVQQLPDQNRVAGSCRFFHDQLVLKGAGITDRYFEENVFQLGPGIDVAAAQYRQEAGEGTLSLMLIRYPSASPAAAVKAAYTRLRATGGETAVEKGRLTLFRAQTGALHAIAQEQSLLIAVFRAADQRALEKLVGQISVERRGAADAR